ncbi:hypothetical protein [Devosia sp.]|uniref:hypothetical protein n=1 Tax=Devosia sp. TaxID=1871048 RepID=UPI002FC7D6B4
MTTLSAGAAAGLLVALMVISTSDGHEADPLPVPKKAAGFVHPGEARGFNPQPDPPVEASQRTAAPRS